MNRHVEELNRAFVLSAGAHADPSTGHCFMEAVAYVAGEPHSDSPECACDMLGWHAIVLNDSIDFNFDRQKLLPLVIMMVGTRSESHLKIRKRILVNEILKLYGELSHSELMLAGIEIYSTDKDFHLEVWTRIAWKLPNRIDDLVAILRKVIEAGPHTPCETYEQVPVPIRENLTKRLGFVIERQRELETTA